MKICVSIPPDTLARLDSFVRAEDRSRSGFIRRAVERALDEIAPRRSRERKEHREARSD